MMKNDETIFNVTMRFERLIRYIFDSKVTYFLQSEDTSDG